MPAIGSDVAALRRIALLVMRAAEDCEPIRGQLQNIAAVIDRMKREVALGVPFERRDVEALSKLIRRLPADRWPAGSSDSRLRESLVGELDELLGA